MFFLILACTFKETVKSFVVEYSNMLLYFINQILFELVDLVSNLLDNKYNKYWQLQKYNHADVPLFVNH